MLGTIVNALAIIAGSMLGLIFRGGIPEKYNKTVLQSISLAVILIGIINALKTEDMLLLIFSLVIGSILGELLRIENRLEKLGNAIENNMKKLEDFAKTNLKFLQKLSKRSLSSTSSNISKGFVNASLIYCIGSMAIIGALESGLTNNHQTLFAKSILDGISSIAFTSSLGIGVLFSAIPVFLYQGFITITASFMKSFLVDSVITEMSAVGGLLILALGLTMLEIKKIRVGNMLPAIFIPLLYYMLRSIF
ncbi:DUF554 domain-containing protein [Paramaledivibacter caminithermalis]|jgi:uncharacterized membrane protein YqgA involved in biofilm formation|uniref:Membrane protein YdfK n=1 Tax=Paramaledivibacter caminithermalis (strain DSM 15212 / CIP 107654 / DViRD3) TaxID=1121301 RepID=A0A1M6P7L1_PARC5|nr:DUF554 domain-containing protein [Paramaledivibacter caminithermalis]SHK03924.1 hypothetical protein SAMN02745912_02036 [Paramaledivibacter caminithermalis DSM 15212]